MKLKEYDAPIQRTAIWLWTLAWAVLAVLVFFRVVPWNVLGPATAFAVTVGLFTGMVSIVFHFNRGGRWY